MKKTEKFNVFIDERIKLAQTTATKAAYIAVQAQFNKLFDEEASEIYNAILDMDIDSDTRTGIFVGDKRADEIFQIVMKVSDLANANHNKECDHNGCPGVISYILSALKIILTSHPEYDASTVLAVIAGVFTELGKRAIK